MPTSWPKAVSVDVDGRDDATDSPRTRVLNAVHDGGRPATSAADGWGEECRSQAGGGEGPQRFQGNWESVRAPGLVGETLPASQPRTRRFQESLSRVWASS